MAEVAVAVADSVASEYAAPADRGIHRRRPAAWLMWMVLGGVGTYVDKIHEYLGVVAYQNPEWIGDALPVSPVYLFATVGFFTGYTLVVGHRGRAQGLFGGRPLSLLDIVFAHASWISVYSVSGYLGAPERAHGSWPWIAAAFLGVSALPDLWQARRTWLPLFAVLLGIFGTGFEWTATSYGGFAYPVCPAAACLGTTVPAAWLFVLYIHAALYVHRMLGGRHAFSQWTRASLFTI
ncbi:MAG: hypothetical protein ACT4TC_24780 [Myxococcaceae bacterium]